jgi:hypothetical protein
MTAVLLAACGPRTANGTVISVRATPQVVSNPVQTDIAAFQDVMQSELAQANDTAAIPGEDQLAAGALPLDTTLTLNQFEKLLTLRGFGQVIIQNRLTAIANVRTRVLAYRAMSLDQKYRLLYLLDRATANLNYMQFKIAEDQYVQTARADVTTVAAFRVYGLLLPEVHVLIRADALIRQAEADSGELQHLNGFLLVPAPGANVDAAAAALNDMAFRIATMNQYASLAISLVAYLSPSGYPGNKTALLWAHKYVEVAKYAASIALNDAAAAKADLHL